MAFYRHNKCPTCGFSVRLTKCGGCNRNVPFYTCKRCGGRVYNLNYTGEDRAKLIKENPKIIVTGGQGMPMMRFVGGKSAPANLDGEPLKKGKEYELPMRYANFKWFELVTKPKPKKPSKSKESVFKIPEKEESKKEK